VVPGLEAHQAPGRERRAQVGLVGGDERAIGVVLAVAVGVGHVAQGVGPGVHARVGVVAVGVGGEAVAVGVLGAAGLGGGGLGGVAEGVRGPLSWVTVISQATTSSSGRVRTGGPPPAE
jgi:hypothetical protein